MRTPAGACLCHSTTKETLLHTSVADSVSRSRRRFLAASAALALSPAVLARAADRPIINAPALLDNLAGGYRVLPAGSVFCGGAIALPGHEIVHALCSRWLPLTEAWATIEGHLKGNSLPVQALCGMELRLPEQLSIEAFRAFNRPYMEQLMQWQLLLGRYSAVCRTNVVPVRNAPKEPSVHAFSYCMPSDYQGTTFCVSGSADIDSRGRIIAEGDVTPNCMKLRVQRCLGATTERLAMLELQWADATHIDLCSGQDLPGLMDSVLVPGLGSAAARGIRFHYARPPIIGTEVELECRGCRREIVVNT